MNFRKDINGLRAIAVIAVVLFHFNADWMPGGFVGVDVFFVISGFLMTGIIFRGIERKNFSILKFYVARANRIIPALAVLCLVLLVFGWFYLSTIDYRALGVQVAGSMGFLSNIIYWMQSGYFDAVSHEKWLLHTWSLSAEWQFYIIYPLVLVVMSKFMSLKAMKRSILVLTVFGFIVSIIASYKSPNAAYYLLHARAWEMMIGGVAYIYPLKFAKNVKKIFEWAGLALIISSYIFISKENLWPGYLALIPTLGVFLIIQAQRNDSFVTGNFIFQSLGKWSYSIYLWHWPLVVAINWYDQNIYFLYLGIIFSVLLGLISYKYIEQTNYKNNFISVTQYLKCKPIYYSLTIGCLGCVMYMSDGLIYRFDDPLLIKRHENAIEAMGDWSYPKPNLKVGNTDVRFIKGSSDRNILFIGASHIEQTYPFVKSFGSKYNIYYVTSSGCFVSQSYIHPKWSCSNIQNYKDIINKVNFDKIVTSIYVIDQNLSENKVLREEQINNRVVEYNDFLKFSKIKSNQVYMILGGPRGQEFDPKMSVRHDLNNFIPVNKIREGYKFHYSALDELSEKEDVKIIDPIDYLCNETCSVMDKNFKYYYKDAGHMRPWYVKNNLHYLTEILN